MPADDIPTPPPAIPETVRRQDPARLRAHAALMGDEPEGAARLRRIAAALEATGRWSEVRRVTIVAGGEAETR